MVSDGENMKEIYLKETQKNPAVIVKDQRQWIVVRVSNSILYPIGSKMEREGIDELIESPDWKVDIS